METFTEAVTDLVDLVMDCYRKLQKLNPNHELLSLATLKEDGEGFIPSDDYRRRIPVKGGVKHVGFERTTNYLFALENAIKGESYQDIVKS